MAGEPLVVWSFLKVKGSSSLSSSRRRNRTGRMLWRMLSWLLIIGALCGCTDSRVASQLEKIKQRGELVVATRIGPATYHPSPNGFSGIEHDLAQLFAQRLGVRVRFLLCNSVAETFQAVEDGRADLAAAGLAITSERERQVRFAPAYRTVTEQVVYRDGNTKPNALADLADGIFEVADGGSHLLTLKHLQSAHPELQWRVSQDHNSAQLLYLVHAGLIDYTVTTSDQALLMRRFLPQLRSAFDLGTRRSLAWAFSKTSDDSLYRQAVAFFGDIQRDKTLDRLNERYFGDARVLPEEADKAFRQSVRERLPRYRHLFHQAAARYQMDWRLLAAIAYQESHWDPNAVSPTGVRGMMMLTEETAKSLKVKNRLDARDSIMAGANYVAQERAEMPEHIVEPDRTWLALVAYNAGPGVLEKTRHLATRLGINPDCWLCLKKVLRLKKGYYQGLKDKHVLLPGRQSVAFVEGVRRYYDLLVYLSDEENFRLTLFQNARNAGAAFEHSS